MYNETINKCCEFEKEILVLNKEKKLLQEKTSKYDQLLDQKRRIEEIVNQMKSSEVLADRLLIFNKILNIIIVEHFF